MSCHPVKALGPETTRNTLPLKKLGLSLIALRKHTHPDPGAL